MIHLNLCTIVKTSHGGWDLKNAAGVLLLSLPEFFAADDDDAKTVFELMAHAHNAGYKKGHEQGREEVKQSIRELLSVPQMVPGT